MTDIIDPITGRPRSTFEYTAVTEILDGRRAFPMTQQLFAGTPAGNTLSLETGWHDTSTSSEGGAFALIDQQSGLDALIGDIVRVDYGRRVVFVYVLDYGDLETPFSLARRAFVHIARPALETVTASVVRVQR